MRRALLLLLATVASAEEWRFEDVVAKITVVNGNEVTIDLGSDDGVIADRHVMFYTVRPKARFAGTGKVLAVEKRTARASVKPKEEKDTPRVGDVVTLSARVPAIPRSALWVFARRRCALRYVGTTEPLVTYRALYRNDPSPELYAAMAQRVGVTAAEVRSFCRYRAAVPWDLIAATLEFETEFAAWVKKDRPLAVDEVLERLVAAGTKDERKALIEKYHSAVRFGAAGLARRRAEAARRGKELEKARTFLTIATEAAALLSLDREGARIAMEEGDLLGAEGDKRDEQLAAYRLAFKRFVGLKNVDHRGAADALERSAWLLKEMKRLDEALADYRAALEQHRVRKFARGEAFCLEWIGRLLANKKQWDESRAALTESIAAWRKTGDKRRVADALVVLGNTHRTTRDQAAALKQFVAAVAIYRELKLERAEAHILAEVASSRNALKEYDGALAAAEHSVPIMRRLEDKPGLALALRERGFARQHLYARDKALADYVEALELYRTLASPFDTADLLELRAGCLLAMNRTKDAQGVYEELLRLDPRFEARALRGLGGIDVARGRFAEALPQLEKAWNKFRESKQSGHASITMNMIAAAREMSGDFDGALAAHRAARADGARHTDMAAMVGEVRIYRILGRLDEALAIYERARRLVTELREDWSLVSILTAGAELYADRGENELAIATYDEALEVCDKIGFDMGKSLVLAKRAREWARQGDQTRALDDYNNAIALDPRPEVGAEVAYGSAEIFWETGDDEEAAKFARIGVDCARTMESQPLLTRNLLLLARALVSQAETTGKDATLAEAEKALAEADAIGRKLKARLLRAEVQRLRGVIAAFRGDVAGARRAFGAALALAKGQPARHQIWLAHWGLSVTEENAGNLDGAAQQMRLCVGVLEEIRGALGGGAAAQKNFLRRRIGVYETLAELLGKLIEKEKDAAKRKQLIDEAMELVARARFERLTPEGVATTGSKKLDELLAKYRQAERDLARQRQQQVEAIASGNSARANSIGVVLAKTEERLAELYYDLKAEDKELGQGLAFDPRSATDGMLDAPDGATLVVYFPGEKNLLLWVFTNKGFQEWRQVAVGRAELYGLVKRYRDLVAEVVDKVKNRETMGRGFGLAAEADEGNPKWYRKHIAEMRAVLRKLHDRLLAPIASHVAKADPLLVLPYGQLSYLPFEALLEPDGTFVGATKRIAYFTSEKHLGKVLDGLGREPRPAKHVWVAYADPRGRLASSLEEADEIKGLFATAEVHSHASGTASEDNLLGLREDCTILHFATHGFLNGVHPSKTYLELDQGELAQSEIWPQLKRKVPPFRKRNVRLVVLSACETARATESVYAEVLGMPNAFAAVGVRAVVASLWSVYTYTTTDLMVDFYRRLIKDGKDPATALRDARKAMLTARQGRYAHPFYWAPFLLFGDWR